MSFGKNWDASGIRNFQAVGNVELLEYLFVITAYYSLDIYDVRPKPYLTYML